MKKFENLGKKLSKEEQKAIMGGDAPKACGTGCSGKCTFQCNGGDHQGTCRTNPNTGHCTCGGVCV